MLAKQSGQSPAWIYAAEFVSDANMGFDITLHVDNESVDVYLIKPPDTEWDACPATIDGTFAAEVEPWAWWAAWW